MLNRLWAADARLEVISRLADNTAFWSKITWPGLIGVNEEISTLVDKLPRRLKILFYKRQTDVAWVVLLGGTGTGKSTVFNMLCGAELSATGVERPKTTGPLAFAHEDAGVADGFPLPLELTSVPAVQAAWHQREGTLDGLVLIEHRSPSHRHFVLIDTPDVDSVEVRNRTAVEGLFFLSDLVMFVTSQEKYADEVPFRILRESRTESKLCLVVLNKADVDFTAKDLDASLQELGVDLGISNILTLPYAPGNPSERLKGTAPFVLLRRSLHDVLSPASLDETLRRQRAVEAQQIRKMASRLFVLLDQERRATKQWVTLLDGLYDLACRELLAEQEQHFQTEGRAYLQREIRKHFAKYDLLKGPRRLLSGLVMAPLKALGLVETRPAESHEEALMRIRKRIDGISIRHAAEGFSRSVLERLCPIDAESALARRLRSAHVHLTPQEIGATIEKEQEDLIQWLEVTFQRLGKGIPKSKEWGIYSTSVIWGALILSVETAIGGGISILEAVFDSAVAPFVTQGAAELFAYRELQVIAAQLGVRCRQALTCVLKEQRDRYVQCVESLGPDHDVMASIEGVVSGIY